MKTQLNDTAATLPATLPLFTPGPWEIFPNLENDSITVGVYGKHAPLVSAVCELPCLASEPDARLIAAAPDLLAACEACADAESAQWGDIDVKFDFIRKAADQARAAIARAKGVQS